MRYFFFTYYILLCFLHCFSQEKTVQEETSIFKKYNSYKKEMYIDNILKEKISPTLYKNYYKNVMLTNYKQGYTQQWDTINKIQRLYLYTQKAEDGFLELNKEVSSFMKILPDSTQILYIQDQDTIRDYRQVLKLISLKEELVRNIKYRKDNNTFIVTVITDKE